MTHPNQLPPVCGTRPRWRRPDFVVLFALALLPFIAFFLHAPGMMIILVACASAMASVFVLSLQGDWRLIGPHFFHDTIGLARRGQSAIVRTAYVLALLAGLGFLYHDTFGELFRVKPGVSTYVMSTFALKYVDLVVVLQNLAILLLTPAYLATALTEERERRTLELLFTSHLSDCEIVLGKLSARLAHLGGVLLAGLPVLSLAQLLGGVSMQLLLANFVNSLLLLATVGSLCIFISTRAATALSAVIRSYVFVLSFSACFALLFSGPPIVISQQNFDGTIEKLWESIVLQLLVHAGLWICFLSDAIRCLRVSPGEIPSTVHASLRQARSVSLPFSMGISVNGLTGSGAATKPKPQTRPSLPAIGDDDPLIWKETKVGGKPFVFTRFFWVLVGGWLITPLIVPASGLLNLWDTYRVLLRLLLIALAWLSCLIVGLRSCACVAFERQQGTLDALLTLPYGTYDILKAKWQGVMIRVLCWGWVVVPLICFLVATRAIHIIGGVVLMLAPVAFAMFLASVGVFFSVISRNVVAAQSKMAMVGMTFLILAVIGPAGGVNSVMIEYFNHNLNPLTCWWSLTADPQEYLDLNDGPWRSPFLETRFMGYVQHSTWIAGHLLIFAGAARLFWILAYQIFEKEWRVTRGYKVP